jgi:hypothetical protein
MFFKKPSNPLVPKKEVRELEDPRQILRSRSSLSSLFERRRINGGARLVEAQEGFVRSLTELEHAFAGLAEARVVKGRAISMLEDAETIYASDAEARQKQRLELQDEREAAKAQLEINQLDRQMALARKRAEYQEFQRRQSGVSDAAPTVEERAPETVPPQGKSQAQREFEADRDHAFGADQARWEMEEKIAEMVAKAGGKEKLTPEQNAVIERMRARLEELIRESGLT